MKEASNEALSVGVLNGLCGAYRGQAKRHVSDASIARAMKISPGRLSQWVNGNNPPRQIDALLELIRAIPDKQQVARILDLTHS
jgi:hypothetical protein